MVGWALTTLVDRLRVEWARLLKGMEGGVVGGIVIMYGWREGGIGVEKKDSMVGLERGLSWVVCLIGKGG